MHLSHAATIIIATLATTISSQGDDGNLDLSYNDGNSDTNEISGILSNETETMATLPVSIMPDDETTSPPDTAADEQQLPFQDDNEESTDTPEGILTKEPVEPVETQNPPPVCSSQLMAKHPDCTTCLYHCGEVSTHTCAFGEAGSCEIDCGQFGDSFVDEQYCMVPMNTDDVGDDNSGGGDDMSDNMDSSSSIHKMSVVNVVLGVMWTIGYWMM